MAENKIIVPKKKFGNTSISQIGLGCLPMSDFYDPNNRVDEESLKTIDEALNLGINFFDTSDAYGIGRNEILLGKAMKGRREKFFLSTKFGFIRDPETEKFIGITGKPDYVKKACEASLKRLGTDYIDLYFLHRVDPETPIEDTVRAMGELVKEGKVRYIGLSEASAETIRRAHKVHPITAVQSEYSLWSLDIQAKVLPTCRELGIAIVPYSPLGRGFLTGQFKKPEDLPENDRRRSLPRFMGKNFQKNLQLVEELEKLAKKKGCSPSQLALAWLLVQGDDIFPIPGTKRSKNVCENVGAVAVKFTDEELKIIDDLLKTLPIAGDRYNGASMKYLDI